MDQNGSDSSPTPLWCPNHCTWVMTVVSEASATFLKCWRYSACSAEIFSSSKRLYKRCAVCCNHLEDSKILEENCQRRRVATQPHSHVFLAKLYNWQSPKQLLSSVQLRAKLKHEKNLLHISFKPRAIRHACDPFLWKLAEPQLAPQERSCHRAVGICISTCQNQAIQGAAEGSASFVTGFT